MSTRKRTYAHKWSMEVLEQVAYSCNIAANARTESDWQLFLQSVYEGVITLTDIQRSILLLSQEFGLSLVDISRINNMPISTVFVTLQMAVDKIVMFLKSRSLTKKNLFTCKAMQMLYAETINMEECCNGPADFEFLEKYSAPWFYSRNPLFEWWKKAYP